MKLQLPVLTFLALLYYGYSIIASGNDDQVPLLPVANTDNIASALLSSSKEQSVSLLQQLAAIPANHLTPSTREAIEQFAQTNVLTLELLTLIDTANIQSAFPRVRELSKTAGRDPGAGKWYGTPEWFALLILARHGDQNAATQAVALLEKEHDLVWRATRGAEIAASLRQPAGVRYLQSLVESEGKLPPLDNGWQEPVYQRALGFLSELLSGFPAQESDENIADYAIRCRKWMKDQGDHWQFKISE